MTDTWTNYMGPLNATRKWLTANTTGPRADYVTDEVRGEHAL